MKYFIFLLLFISPVSHAQDYSAFSEQTAKKIFFALLRGGAEVYSMVPRSDRDQATRDIIRAFDVRCDYIGGSASCTFHTFDATDKRVYGNLQGEDGWWVAFQLDEAGVRSSGGRIQVRNLTCTLKKSTTAECLFIE
jgi:hypothetical protein